MKNTNTSMLRTAFILLVCSFLLIPANAFSVKKQRYKVSVCDWMILKRQKLGEFKLASEIGSDGVTVDMGGLGTRENFDNKLVTDSFRVIFKNEAKKYNIEMSTIAMSAFYGQSFAKRPDALRLVGTAIETMKQMKVKEGFLPIENPNLVTSPEFTSTVIARLKEVSKMAEKANVVIGIQSQISASEMVKILDAVGSKSIKATVNFANIISANRDICSELQVLGKNRIAQIHVSNTDSVWIQNDPKIDMPKVKATLDKMGWSGWLVVERSRDVKDVHNVKKNYGANAIYLKSVFQGK
jgi:Sugar phosphate isomerases/epimerases